MMSLVASEMERHAASSESQTLHRLALSAALQGEHQRLWSAIGHRLQLARLTCRERVPFAARRQQAAQVRADAA